MSDNRDQLGIDVLSFGASKPAASAEPETVEQPEKKELLLEEMMAEIDAISSEMETGELSLEDSFRKYKQGMSLVRQCTKEIASVEKQIQVLDEQGDLDDF